MSSFPELLLEIKNCSLCKASLPLQPNPILQIHPSAKILIIAQAPGQKAHHSNLPFNDASGERLRNWMDISRTTFYDHTQIAILPMGFCYPGKGNSGDLPPRPECMPVWHDKILTTLPDIKLKLVIGQYAQKAYCYNTKRNVTEHVKDWQSNWPEIIPLPHPSPTNNRWFKNNPWFEIEVLPALRNQITKILQV